MLELIHISKFYNSVPALRDVSLTAQTGEIVCLLGPSGCGKSTLLRIVAGLEHADAGTVRFDGMNMHNVPTHKRGFGLMFQEYALFPHMSVTENVGYGLQQETRREARQNRVHELLDLVGLSGYGARRVDSLSGGERQRVALARSLAPSPRLLMLDEPLGALDRALRERLLQELRLILKRVGVMSLYVTHDQAEAFAIADRLVLMNRGQIEQQGAPEQVYRRPATRFAATFLGLSNLVGGVVVDVTSGRTTVETALGMVSLAESIATHGARVVVVLRPEAAQLGDANGNTVHGTLIERSFRGTRTRITVQPTAGSALEFELDAPALPAVGEPITLSVRPDGMSLIPT